MPLASACPAALLLGPDRAGSRSTRPPRTQPAGGELLDAVNNKGHYSEADARTIFCQLMSGIRYLHSK
jgi:hypothetical protein